ncbi:P-loop containing nucleoside triphosphate hydrolase protein [Butyriboletus roseoflavus]|nr:P-loop containing nucleoside triphosphate hydrolase protein [Butyriboletus roseoflavus]
MPAAKETSLPLSGKQLKVEDVQEVYVEQKENLLGAIDATQAILAGLREFNKNDWVVRYPTLQAQPNDASVAPSKAKLRCSIRRSLTFADDPSCQTEIVYTPSRQGSTRTVTLASIADACEHPNELADENAAGSDKETLSDKSGDFTILRLDLKLGPHGSSASPVALVSQLEKGSIANLLDERISAALQHMNKLRLRVEDTSSKVLVTGDLNSGKSTFVNALLRREVHVLKDGVRYSIADESTFSRVSLTDLENIVTDNEGDQPRLKVYLADSRATSESLLNNGVVDISLIDAPGLNRDNLKTTAVFTRQEEIDVIVFVVSAENHFTLSAKEFLWNASNEKAYLFVVVNKFEQIKNKEKCKRAVLEQIAEFSPRTHENAQDLVHFVDSAAALRPYTCQPCRTQSKLHPVSTYLSKLLIDIDLLVGANAIVAQMDIDRAKGDLERAKPVYEKMKSERETLEDALETAEENGASSTANKTKAILSSALERVGRGQPGVDVAISLPRFPGFLGIRDYARDVRKVLLASLDIAVKLAEDEARLATYGRC